MVGIKKGNSDTLLVLLSVKIYEVFFLKLEANGMDSQIWISVDQQSLCHFRAVDSAKIPVGVKPFKMVCVDVCQEEHKIIGQTLWSGKIVDSNVCAWD